METVAESTAITKVQDSMVYTPAALAAMAAEESSQKVAAAMARRFPRDWDSVRQDLLKECRRTSFAEAARFAKPIGAGKVHGWTIRFAEAALGTATHMHTTVRTIVEDDEHRLVAVKVWDAQTMVSYSDEVNLRLTVERKSVDKSQEVVGTRLNKQGEQLYIIRATEDDLNNKLYSAVSKRIRTNGLRLIPGWLLAECLKEVNATLAKTTASDPDAAKKQVIDSLLTVGIPVEIAKKFVGHDLDTLSPSELVELRGLYTGIRDNEFTLRDVIQQIEGENGEGTGPTNGKKSVRDTILEKQKVALDAKVKAEEEARQKQQAPQGSLLPDSDPPLERTGKVTSVIAPVGTKPGIIMIEGKEFETTDKAAIVTAAGLKGAMVHINYRKAEGGKLTLVSIERLA